jgi:hypothetical protein
VGPPSAVPEVAVTVKVTVTGFPAVGLTEAEGKKWQAVPLGRPEQLKVTGAAKIPEAVTWNVLPGDVAPCATTIELGLGAVRLKSTMCKVTGTSCRSVCESVPTA